MDDTLETSGLSQRELLLELRVDVKGIIEDRADERVEVAQQLAGKVGRAELWKILSVFGAVGLGVAGIVASLGV